MKKIVFFVSLLSFTLTAHDPFKEILLPKQQTIDQAYYKLLPKVDDKEPDLLFIPSRQSGSMSLNESFLEILESVTYAGNFIETGTYLGDSTALAANHFPQVHSIELGDELFQKAQKRFAKNKNIHLYHGDSAQLLPSIIKKIKDKTIIFLDAHFSMGATARGQVNTPIITELEQIRKSGMKNAIIIIDDARMFYEPITAVKDTFIEGYPTLNQIVQKILQINDTYQCAIIYDVLIAFPAQENITISPLVRALTISRLYDGTNYDIYDVLKAELLIAHATTSKEREAIIDLAQNWIEEWSKPSGLSRHYALWYGLILMGNEDYKNAEKYFREAKKRGLIDWRIDWYIKMAEAQIFFGIR